MDILFYLLACLAFIMAGISAKKKNMRIIGISIIVGIAFFGVGKLLESGYPSNDVKTNPKKNTVVTKKEKDFPLVTKEQYNKVNIGMTIKEVSNIFGKKPSDYYIAGTDGNETWTLDGENESSVDFYFENSKLVEKSEVGLLSASSNTITDKKGTRKDNTTVTSDAETQDNSERYNEIESTIKSIIDKDFFFDTSLKKFELNENLGTDKKDDYVALIYLSYNQVHSKNTTKKWIDKYTNDLAAQLAKKEPNITLLSIFWETPRFKKDWNTAKFNLTRKGNTFYFDTENYDGTVFK